jgi:hypothetical protein
VSTAFKILYIAVIHYPVKKDPSQDPTANLIFLNTLVIPQPSQHLQSRYTVISHYLSP